MRGLLALALVGAACRSVSGAGELTFEQGEPQRLVWSGLAPAALEALVEAPGDLLELRVAGEGRVPRPMLGRHEVREGALVFEPRFPLREGRAYRASAHPALLPGARGDEPELVLEFRLDLPERGPAARVSAVHPDAAVLPANLLKFYVHFSAPMARGEAYRRVSLLDAAGEVVPQPFLELGEELWNREGTRLTLFLDPGRVKRGLFLREELGPVLSPEGAYTLVVDGSFRSADGRPLAEGARHGFRAGGYDHEQPKPERWSVAPPDRGSRAELVVRADEALDRALFARSLDVIHEDGARIGGEVRVLAEGREWRLMPEGPWRSGEYALLVQPILEDLAGNSVGRPFEDVLAGVETLSVGSAGADEVRRVLFRVE